MDDRQLLLFSKQIMMPKLGVEHQQRLLNSRVMIVGAGGLGCSVAQTLAGSGVGHLLIIDDDKVELSNLPRQFLFGEEDIGKNKAEILCKRLQQRLPDIHCTAKVARFCENHLSTWGEHNLPHVIADAGDNLPLSWQLDKIADNYQLPLVHASVSRFEGHIYVRLPHVNYPTLMQLFPQTAENESCSQSGVLSAAVAMVANYQATQVLRVLLSPVLGEIPPELVLFDGMTMRYLPMALDNLPT